KEETRTVPLFNVIEVSGAIAATVTAGADLHVVIITDENLLDKVKTTVVDGRLRVAPVSGFQSQNGVKVRIAAPVVNALLASGASTIEAAALTGAGDAG